MDRLAQNWIWIPFAVSFFGMYLLGDRGRGGHASGVVIAQTKDEMGLG